jgi:hypothetical protein
MVQPSSHLDTEGAEHFQEVGIAVALDGGLNARLDLPA